MITQRKINLLKELELSKNQMEVLIQLNLVDAYIDKMDKIEFVRAALKDSIHYMLIKRNAYNDAVDSIETNLRLIEENTGLLFELQPQEDERMFVYIGKRND